METDMKNISLAVKTLVLGLLMATSAYAQQKVNINTADAATLDKVLINIGPSKAEAIVAHRKQNGAFKSVDQLANVKGIGLSTVEKNRNLIVLGGAPAAVAAKPVAAKTVAAKPAVKK
jgi:competence protein ComEA